MRNPYPERNARKARWRLNLRLIRLSKSRTLSKENTAPRRMKPGDWQQKVQRIESAAIPMPILEILLYDEEYYLCVEVCSGKAKTDSRFCWRNHLSVGSPKTVSKPRRNKKAPLTQEILG